MISVPTLWFNAIVAGTKVREAFVRRDAWAPVRTGDTVLFREVTNDGATARPYVIKVITGVSMSNFPFADHWSFAVAPPHTFVPGALYSATVVAEYTKRYPLKDQKRHGTVVIYFG